MLDESTSSLVLTLLGVLFGLILQALCVLGYTEYREAVRRAADRRHPGDLDPAGGARLKPTPNDLARLEGSLRASSPWVYGTGQPPWEPAPSKPLVPASTLLSELGLFVGLLPASGLFRPSWGFLIGALVAYLVSLGLFILADRGQIPSRLPGLGGWFA